MNEELTCAQDLGDDSKKMATGKNLRCFTELTVQGALEKLVLKT